MVQVVLKAMRCASFFICTFFPSAERIFLSDMIKQSLNPKSMSIFFGNSLNILNENMIASNVMKS